MAESQNDGRVMPSTDYFVTRYRSRLCIIPEPLKVISVIQEFDVFRIGM